MIVKQLTNPIDLSVSLPLFEFSDRYGQISIHQMGNVMITQFSGPCGAGIVEKYAIALEKTIRKYDQKPWAYLSISNDFEAATDSAIVMLIHSFSQSRKLGCVADAYIIKSVLGKEQVRKLRDKFDTGAPFSEVSFESFDDAFSYLDARLNDKLKPFLKL